MAGRTVSFFKLAAWGCGLAPVWGLTSPCAAQQYSGYQPAPAGAYAPPGAYPEAFPGAFNGPPVGYDSNPDGGGPSGGGVVGAGYCPPADCGPVSHRPRPAHFWENIGTKLWIAPPLLEPPRGASVRTEYLLWGLSRPGDQLLGAPITRPDNSRFPFTDEFEDGVIRNDPDLDVPTSYVPFLDPFELRDISGARTTVSVPLMTYGTAELSGFVLSPDVETRRFDTTTYYEPTFLAVIDTGGTAATTSATGGFESNTSAITYLPDGIPFTVVPATSLKENGAQSELLRFYDSLDVAYHSQLWGMDAKFVYDSLSTPGEGFKLRPLFGVKYLSFNEKLYQSGTFTEVDPLTGLPVSQFDTEIHSGTKNNYIGGTVGVRSELVHRWFVVGVQPSVTLAADVAQADTLTENLTGPNDALVRQTERFTTFAPLLEGNAYARFCLTENIRFHVGYDVTWITKAYRPGRTIEYDTTSDGAGVRSNVRPEDRTDDVIVDGLSLGAEFVF